MLGGDYQPPGTDFVLLGLLKLRPVEDFGSSPLDSNLRGSIRAQAHHSHGAVLELHRGIGGQHLEDLGAGVTPVVQMDAAL
jgi:hypothetical protein